MGRPCHSEAIAKIRKDFFLGTPLAAFNFGKCLIQGG